MFLAQEVFRKRAPDGFKEKMRAAREAIAREYGSELAPREVIRAWKEMSPEERAAARAG
jgi:hypothetical protein